MSSEGFKVVIRLPYYFKTGKKADFQVDIVNNISVIQETKQAYTNK